MGDLLKYHCLNHNTIINNSNNTSNNSNPESFPFGVYVLFRAFTLFHLPGLLQGIKNGCLTILQMCKEVQNCS